MKHTICIDFDHTIRDLHVEGEGTEESPYFKVDRPFPGARDAISKLREKGYLVVIHSCNDPDFIEQWMNNYDIRHDGIWTVKPVGTIYIDDRALRFEGDWHKTLNTALGLINKEG